MESFRTAVIQFDGDLSDGYYQIRDLNTFCNDLISDHSSVFVRADDTHLVMIYFIEGSERLSELQNYLLQIQNRIHHHFHKTVSMGWARSTMDMNLCEKLIFSRCAPWEKVLHWKSKREFLFCGGYQWKQPAAYGLLFYIILFQQNYRLDRTVERNLFSTAGRRAFWGTIGTPSWKNRFYPQHLFNRGGSDNKKIFSNDNRQLALLFEKYSNFQKVIQAQSTQELGDLFVELILDLSDYRSIKSSNRQMLIQNVISYISENYQENISLNDAAKKYFCLPLI